MKSTHSLVLSVSTIQDIDLVKSKYLGKNSILKREYDKIKTYIDDAVNNGYKRILILLADKNFSNLEISIALSGLFLVVK